MCFVEKRNQNSNNSTFDTHPSSSSSPSYSLLAYFIFRFFLLLAHFRCSSHAFYISIISGFLSYWFSPSVFCISIFFYIFPSIVNLKKEMISSMCNEIDSMHFWNHFSLFPGHSFNPSSFPYILYVHLSNWIGTIAHIICVCKNTEHIEPTRVRTLGPYCYFPAFTTRIKQLIIDFEALRRARIQIKSCKINHPNPKR